MKYILIVLLLFSCAYGIAQPIRTEPKRASKLIVENNLSKQDNFKKASSLIIQNGYMIDSRDLELGTIITKPKSIKYSSVMLNLVIVDNKIIVKGLMNTGTSFTMYGVTAHSTWVNIQNRGMKGSAMAISFIEMHKLYKEL